MGEKEDNELLNSKCVDFGCGKHFFHECCLADYPDDTCPWGSDLKDPCLYVKGGVKTGNQPRGFMTHRILQRRLPEFDCDTIYVSFRFLRGLSKDGQIYDARNFHAFLPDNEEGQQLLELYRIAFQRRMMFELGNGLGQGCFCVTFKIHIKTTMEPQPKRNQYDTKKAYEKAIEHWHGWLGPNDPYITESRGLGECAKQGVTVDDLD